MTVSITFHYHKQSDFLITKVESSSATGTVKPQMDLTSIESLACYGNENAVEFLTKLSLEWAQRYEFAELNGDQKRLLVDGLCHHMESQSSSNDLRRLCVESVRLLSRDKTDIERWIDERLMSKLVQFAGFVSIDQQSRVDHGDGCDLDLEAQKALCNLMFQSEKARRLCIGNKCLDGVCRRIEENPDQRAQDYDRRFYDLRLLFLLTALCPDVRSKCRDAPMNGLRSLTNILDALIRGKQSDTATVSKSAKLSLSEKECNLVCETLKVAFNLVLPYKLSQVDEHEVEKLDGLADILREALFASVTDESKREDLISNVVNLLAALPSSCYTRLTPKIDTATTAAVSSAQSTPISTYEGRNMESVQILLDFLKSRLDKPPREQLEALSPILTLLIDMTRKHRHFRKYMRFKVLPPLTDVMRRPEEGDTLRNKLVRLMTSVTTEVKDLAADFLFELCNRSIDRLIKYTGFGNAAGMLSMHGLMGAAVSGRRDNDDNDEGENSDTEEYLRVRDQINPIIGCYEEPRGDPMAGMSDEQKEYEAMKLVEQIDKLMKQGVVVPGRLGDDGRVHPVEHVLQLAEQHAGVIRRDSSTDEEVDE